MQQDELAQVFDATQLFAQRRRADGRQHLAHQRHLDEARPASRPVRDDRVDVRPAEVGGVGPMRCQAQFEFGQRRAQLRQTRQQPARSEGLANGHLVMPFKRRVASGMSYFLTYPAERAGARKLTAFEAWLRAQFAPDKPPGARQRGR
jgi:hypothetical protein